MKFYIDKNQIERLASNKDVYRRGTQYFNEKRIGDIDFLEENEESVISGRVTGRLGAYAVQIRFDQKGMLARYSCTCPAFGVWRGCCKHIVAMLLEIYAMNRENAVLSKSFRVTQNLLTAYEKNLYEDIEKTMAHNVEPLSTVEITPTFCTDADGSYYLTLSVGRTKKYIVKNMGEFFKAWEEKAVVSYGKELSFPHRKELLDDQSRKLLQLLMREHSTIEEIRNGILGYTASSVGDKLWSSRKMPMSAKGLDQFFEQYKEDVIGGAIYGTVENMMALSEEKPPLHFHITKKQEGIALSLGDKENEGNTRIELFKGEKYHYLWEGGILYRLQKDYLKVVGPLLHSFQVVDKQTLLFPKKEQQKLSAFLIPQLQKFDLLTYEEIEDDFVQSLIPDMLHKKIYLDMEKGNVTAEVKFQYGDGDGDAENGVKSFNAITLLEDMSFSIPSEGTPILRNISEEFSCKALLSGMGFVPDSERGLFVMDNADLIYRFYYEENGLETLRTFGKSGEDSQGENKSNTEVFATDKFLNVANRQPKQTQIGFRINGELLEVDIKASGYDQKELAEILQSYQLKKKYHRLKNGDFLSLEKKEGETDENLDSLETLAELANGLVLTEKEKKSDNWTMPKYRALFVENILEEKGASVSKDMSFTKLTEDFKKLPLAFAEKAKNTGTGHEHEEGDLSAIFPLPSSLQDIMRPYQKEGFYWLKTLTVYGFGGILADDMGLGKTLQTISLLLSEYEQKEENGKARPSLVVAPTSLLYNWDNEFKKFAPALETLLVMGSAEKRKQLLTEYGDSKRDIVFITTYDMLKRDAEVYQSLDMRFRFIIADEAQNIKNPGTKNAKALKLLKGDIRLALTGTPIENSLMELWSIFDFIMPGFLLSAGKFAKIYEYPILKEESEVTSVLLKKQIAPFILRRLKKDVLKELPDKIETTMYVDMTVEQRKLYTAFLMKTKGEIEELDLNESPSKQIEVLSMIMRLRQICCHPAVFVDNYRGGSGKLDVTLETIRDSISGGHRILIFSQFTKMLGLIHEKLLEENIACFYLDGATPTHQRMKMVEDFNGGAKDVFLISLKAGGTGLNLTGADIVIHFDPWWNPAVMEQATDRAHRFGQEKTVQVFHVVAKDSIEEKIMTLQEKKKELITSVIEGESGELGQGHPLTKLTVEEIRGLFL